MAKIVYTNYEYFLENNKLKVSFEPLIEFENMEDEGNSISIGIPRKWIDICSKRSGRMIELFYASMKLTQVTRITDYLGVTKFVSGNKKVNKFSFDINGYRYYCGLSEYCEEDYISKDIFFVNEKNISLEDISQLLLELKYSFEDTINNKEKEYILFKNGISAFAHIECSTERICLDAVFSTKLNDTNDLSREFDLIDNCFLPVVNCL